MSCRSGSSIKNILSIFLGFEDPRGGKLPLYLFPHLANIAPILLPSLRTHTPLLLLVLIEAGRRNKIFERPLLLFLGRALAFEELEMLLTFGRDAGPLFIGGHGLSKQLEL